MKRLIAAVATALLAACGGGNVKGPTGGLDVGVSGAAITAAGPNAAANVASVSLTAICDSYATGCADLFFGPVASGLPAHKRYEAIAVGGYTFTAEAFDAGGTLLFTGSMHVVVEEDKVGLLTIVMQQAVAPATVNIHAPVILGIGTSDLTPAMGQLLHITAAVAPNPDVLTYAWTTSCDVPTSNPGSVPNVSIADYLSSPTKLATDLVSYCPGTETITFSATDPSLPEGVSITSAVSVSFKMNAQGADVTIVANSWPDITGISASPNAEPTYGGTVQLGVFASDADSDALTLSWDDNCGGSFSGLVPSTGEVTWTAPTGTGSPVNCALTVSASDGRGGTNSAHLFLTAIAP